MYQLGLVVVAVTMVILPVLYVLLTALAGYGVYRFAVDDFPAIWEWPIGHNRYSVLIKLICSVTPLLAGSLVVLFMVKPLFARRAASMDPVAVNPAMEPRFHQLVLEICQLVGAPTPTRLEVTCDLNAAARFAGGFRSIFTNNLTLMVGMPLVAGLTQRELAGVIAHEFGHFRQGAGMRLSYIIRSVNNWFARLVYERDSWDATLEGAAETDSGWVAMVVACCRLSVWLSRRLLWVLMMTGHSVCCVLLRQMEFDADRAEVAVAGSPAFESTSLKLATLGGVFSDIHREMAKSWQSNFRLPDNLPVLLEHRVQGQTEEKKAALVTRAVSQKTGFFDTHPSTADRIARARALALPGLEISDAPARDLFENFDTLSKIVTLAHYEDDLEVPTTQDFLVPIELIVAAGTATEVASVPVKPAAMPMMGYDPTAFQQKATE